MMLLDNDVYRSLCSRRVCVTGARGRIGARVLRRLLEAGVDAVGFGQGLPESVNFKNVWVQGSLLCQGDVDAAVAGCNVVIHLAARTDAERSYEAPLEFLSLNGMGTINLLEACRKASVERVVYASTGHVYGRQKDAIYAENGVTEPPSPYGASKLIGETAIQSYARTFGLVGVICRISNVYGAAMGSNTVIGKAIEQMNTGQSIKLNDFRPVRDFVYVDDVVEALLRLAVTPNVISPAIVNVSSGKGASIRSIANLLAAIGDNLGIGPVKVVEPPYEDNNLSEIILDNHKLQKLTGWIPETKLEEGLRLTVMSELRGIR